MVPVSIAVFEPRFYERRAQRHLAALAGGPVWINVPWGLTGNPSTRPEVDAIVPRAGRAVAAEVKAHQVDADTAREITRKYRSLGFRDLIVIAPGFTASASRSLAHARQPAIERLSFSPDLSEIADFYHGGWQEAVPGWVHDALATGLHHVRFVLTRPTARGRLVVGQARTRVYGTSAIIQAIGKLPSPPARVLWAPQRFTIPRDLIARRSRLTALGGPQWTGVLLSGGRGIHAYLPDDGEARGRVLAAAGTRLRIDAPVTASLKTTIALPGSLHAANGRPVAAAPGPEPLLMAVPC